MLCSVIEHDMTLVEFSNYHTEEGSKAKLSFFLQFENENDIIPCSIIEKKHNFLCFKRKLRSKNKLSSNERA